MEKQLLSRREAAEIFGVTKETVSNYVKQGVIKAIHQGDHTLITRASVERVLNDLRTDDEIAAETAKYRRLTRENNIKARKEYADAHSNASLLHMLNNSDIRDILKTIVRSMGHRHLKPYQCTAVIEFIGEWKKRSAEEMFGITLDGARFRMRKALRVLESLPSYSDLEDKIDRLKTDNKTLSEQCLKLQGKVGGLTAKLKRPNDAKEEANPYSIDDLRMYELLQTKLVDMNLSVRCMNCLRYMDIETIGDLVQYEKTDLLKVRNFGRKSLQELDDMLESLNLSYGMDTSRYKDAYYEHIKNKYIK